MNVFKKGNKPYIYYARCEECGSIISFMKSELSWSHRLECPVCKSSISADICLHEDDPYLGNEEVKREVEEYLTNKEKIEAPNWKPAYVPKKGEVAIKVDLDNIDEIIAAIKDSSEYESVLEKILREVRVESIPSYPRDDKPYEPSKTTDQTVPYRSSKTNDWIDPYGVTTALL